MYKTEHVPFQVVGKGLVVLVTNINMKHSITSGPHSKSAYVMYKDNCEQAAKKLGKGVSGKPQRKICLVRFVALFNCPYPFIPSP